MWIIMEKQPSFSMLCMVFAIIISHQFFKQINPFPIWKTLKGNEKIANSLLENGADVNFATNNGLTPLHLAARLSNSNALLFYIVIDLFYKLFRPFGVCRCVAQKWSKYQFDG